MILTAEFLRQLHVLTNNNDTASQGKKKYKNSIPLHVLIKKKKKKKIYIYIYIYIIYIFTCISHVFSNQLKNKERSKRDVAAVGFEPTPPRRLVP